MKRGGDFDYEMLNHINTDLLGGVESTRRVISLIAVIILLTGVPFVISGCAAGGTFYSARTLRPGKFAPGFAGDDLFMKSVDPNVSVTTSVLFVPSFLFSVGLPWRFEADAKFVIPRLLEVSLRDQLNPRSFKLLDVAPEITFGDLVGGYTYLEYGGTASKDISGVEPYLHFGMFKFLHSNSGDFSNSFFSAPTRYITNKSRILGFGIGVPLGELKLYPEVDYQYFGASIKEGVLAFGIGLRGIQH